MIRTTLGRLLVDEQLPEDLRTPGRVLDKAGISKLFEEVADKHPDDYTAIARRLSDVGRDVAFSTGGFSFGLKHLRPAASALKHRAALEREINAIDDDVTLTDDEQEKRIIAATEANAKAVETEIYDESLAEKNPLALQILSGTRGNRSNLKSLRGGDLLYTDHRDRIIPVPILRSYSEGLRPEEYFAGAFGARKGVLDTKLAVMDAGAFNKQLVQASHRLVTTAVDEDEPEKNDGTRGLPVRADDPDNEGALLARDVGEYKRNTILTPRVLKAIQASGVEHILVRSPIVGGPSQGGVYSRDVGVRERGRIAPVGDYVGITAGQSIGEKLTQGSLSSKHGGGVAGAGASVSGFKYINSLVQIPKQMVGGATHAQRDGRVLAIRPAPQGGLYIDIDGEEHHIRTGLNPKVEVGAQIEAGDVLSDGVPNPGEVVKHKGVGEGRRYFTQAFRDAFRDTGMYANRRNIELLSRGLINHVNVDEEFGDYVPGDVVPDSTVERDWEPRIGTATVAPGSAIGKHIEVPVLHYSIGTKVKPSMLENFKRFGINSVQVHKDPPPFSPVMIRGLAGLQYDPDPIVRHLGSNLQKSTLDSVHRGLSSDADGTSFVSALADPTDFGRVGLTAGWKPANPIRVSPVGSGAPEPKDGYV